MKNFYSINIYERENTMFFHPDEVDFQFKNCTIRNSLDSIYVDYNAIEVNMNKYHLHLISTSPL